MADITRISISIWVLRTTNMLNFVNNQWVIPCSDHVLINISTY